MVIQVINNLDYFVSIHKTITKIIGLYIEIDVNQEYNSEILLMRYHYILTVLINI